MLKRLAEFRLRHSWPLAPAPQPIVPANDNRPTGQHPRRRRPDRSKRLVCRWSPIEGRTGLGCRWDIEDIAEQSPPAPGEDLPARAVHRTVFKASYQKEAAGAARSITRPGADCVRPFDRIDYVAPTSLDNVIWPAHRRTSFQPRMACHNPVGMNCAYANSGS